MPSRPRRPDPGPSRGVTQSTADVTSTLASALRGVAVGPDLDRLVRNAFERLGHRLPAGGFSTTWVGAQQVAACLTALGCYLETQIHSDRTMCRILHVLKGNAVAKQLASADAPQLPEAVARAAVLACLEMEPPPPH
jgi:hypothetical protein